MLHARIRDRILAGRQLDLQAAGVVHHVIGTVADEVPVGRVEMNAEARRRLVGALPDELQRDIARSAVGRCRLCRVTHRRRRPLHGGRGVRHGPRDVRGLRPHDRVPVDVRRGAVLRLPEPDRPADAHQRDHDDDSDDLLHDQSSEQCGAGNRGRGRGSSGSGDGRQTRGLGEHDLTRGRERTAAHERGDRGDPDAGGQRLAQPLAPALQPRLDGVDRATERARDRGRCEAVREAHGDDDAQVLRQRLHRRAELFLHLRRFEQFDRRRFGARRELRRIGLPRALASRGPSVVDEDADEPRHQRPFAVPAIALLDRVEERRLHQILTVALGDVPRDEQQLGRQRVEHRGQSRRVGTPAKALEPALRGNSRPY